MWHISPALVAVYGLESIYIFSLMKFYHYKSRSTSHTFHYPFIFFFYLKYHWIVLVTPDVRCCSSWRSLAKIELALWEGYVMERVTPGSTQTLRQPLTPVTWRQSYYKVYWCWEDETASRSCTSTRLEKKKIGVLSSDEELLTQNVMHYFIRRITVLLIVWQTV